MRYYPEIQWSKDSWTHNIFRFWEMIFGAPLKIKLQVIVGFDGKNTVSQAHSFEGACSLFETFIRGLLKKRFPVKVWIPKLSTTSGLPSPLSNYMFAIAFDAKADEITTEGSSPVSWTHTCTGSNLALVVGIAVNNGQIHAESHTYQSEDMK